VSVEDVVRLVREVLPPEGALSIDEAHDNQAAWTKHARRLAQHGPLIRHEAEGGHDMVEDLERRVDAERDAQRPGEAPGAHPDLEAAPLPGQQGTHGEQLGDIGGPVSVKPPVVASMVTNEGVALPGSTHRWLFVGGNRRLSNGMAIQMTKPRSGLGPLGGRLAVSRHTGSRSGPPPLREPA
jgi:hypothetical protein